ncbi:MULTISPECIES: lytic transglycosylase domain-containing protein [unclassified Roseitalea]|uniref:lytic transglycosylase domain-containing protein n=1 Tax=unclassified Roseitalea TaxID=2639107 RepID=UPI00273F0D1E|nr:MULTISPECIES: lytic transglycosylase domain-containing protein [unclassified Roseitalea]
MRPHEVLAAALTHRVATLLLAALICYGAESERAFAEESAAVDHSAICGIIEREATRNGLPPAYFARLIWTESRFDANAVSPAGAEGIAQFMPATAARRGLADSFDPRQALPASATYLAALRLRFGNLGLAAAAYNAGEDRVDRWLAGRSNLPLETENYVLRITGEPAEVFAPRERAIRDLALEDGKTFRQACERLPVIRSAAVPMAGTLHKPWAIQLAGNFSRAAAMRSWQRIRARHDSALRDLPMAVSRQRTARGPKPLYVVRVGADSRNEANAICGRIRAGGGSCMVIRN